MGNTPIDWIIAWFNRPRPCQECGTALQRGELCSKFCEDEIADRMAY
jgi:hypothetical protein